MFYDNDTPESLSLPSWQQSYVGSLQSYKRSTVTVVPLEITEAFFIVSRDRQPSIQTTVFHGKKQQTTRSGINFRISLIEPCSGSRRLSGSRRHLPLPIFRHRGPEKHGI